MRIRVDYHSEAVDKTTGRFGSRRRRCSSAIYEDETMTIPHGETVIRAGQSILAFADEPSMEELSRIFGAPPVAD